MNFSRFLLIGAAIVLPSVAFAVEPGQSFVPLTNIPGLTDLTTAPQLPIFLNNLYKLCIGVAAVLAVLQIIRGGIIYMGGDSVTEKKTAKDLIRVAILGLLLVLSPVIVFSIINPKILDLDLSGSIAGIKSKGLESTANEKGTSTANPPASVIQSTGKANPGCPVTFADGQVISSTGNDEQCCANQTSATITCSTAARTDSKMNYIEYCSCTKK
jgi:hypothetical protein